MPKITNAEFLPSPANGRTPNIIRIPSIVPVTLDPELGWYYYDKTRQSALSSVIQDQTWDGYTPDLALVNIDIAVDFRKKRINVHYPKDGSELLYLSFLSIQS